MATLHGHGNPPILVQDAPDRARGARQALGQGGGRLGMVQIIEDGLGAGRALEMTGRLIANLEDAVDDGLTEGGRRVLAGTRATVEDGVILGRGGAQARATS
jgi:hypothetical protein